MKGERKMKVTKRHLGTKQTIRDIYKTTFIDLSHKDGRKLRLQFFQVDYDKFMLFILGENNRWNKNVYEGSFPFSVILKLLMEQYNIELREV